MPRPPLPRAWSQLGEDERRQHAAIRRVRSAVQTNGALPPHESAKAIGLRYVNDCRMAGIRRVGRKNRFRYVDVHGRTISNAADLQRIRSLVIPPAWTDVWICTDPLGHLQATGRDARGRKQYRYHPRWRTVRDEVKYGRLIAFAEALPRIRARTEADLRRSGLPREKVLAAVVRLLEKTLIRVGNEEYARDNGSIGLTTMRDRHATVRGERLRFEFRGKSGIEHAVDLRDARLARIIKACRDLPGYELFQYVEDDGARQLIDSSDVNRYLRDTCGEDFTAKDFRTWAGTVLAAKALAGSPAPRSQAHAKRIIASAVEAVSHRLGNTKAVCRKSYIHPAVFDAYTTGSTIAAARGRVSSRGRCGLTVEERAVVALLKAAVAKPAMPRRRAA
jgi:DNA topoisomerase I